MCLVNLKVTKSYGKAEEGYAKFSPKERSSISGTMHAWMALVASVFCGVRSLEEMNGLLIILAIEAWPGY